MIMNASTIHGCLVMKNKLDISVIVPLYGGSCYLNGINELMHKNAAAAPGLSIELVLINDDPGEKIALPDTKAFAFQVQLRSHSENLGILRSRLDGAAIAEGEYLLFLDQDDAIADNALSVLYKTAEGGDGALSDWYLEIKTAEGICRKKQAYKETADFLAALLLCENVIGPPGHCLIKKEIVRECWRDLSLSNEGADDYYLYLRFLQGGHSFKICREPLYTHKYNEKSYSRQIEKVNRSKEEVLSLIADRYAFSDQQKKRLQRFLHYQISREALLAGGAPVFRRYLFYIRHLRLFLYHMYMHKKTYRA